MSHVAMCAHAVMNEEHDYGEEIRNVCVAFPVRGVMEYGLL